MPLHYMVPLRFVWGKELGLCTYKPGEKRERREREGKELGGLGNMYD